MDWRDLISERAKLEDELREIAREDAAAERARLERQARHLEIMRRLGYISAVERMLESLPLIEETASAPIAVGTPAPKKEVAAHGRVATRRRRLKHANGRGTYGTGIETIRKILKATARDLSPSEIRNMAAKEYGVSLNAGSVRSTLRRMAEKTGEAVRRGDRYAYARAELPLETPIHLEQETEGRSDAETPNRPS